MLRCGLIPFALLARGEDNAIVCRDRLVMEGDSAGHRNNRIDRAFVEAARDSTR